MKKKKQTFRTPGETTEQRKDFWRLQIAEAREYPGGVLKYCRDQKIGKELFYRWFRALKAENAEWQTPLNTNEKRRKYPRKPAYQKNSLKRTRPEWRALVVECKELRMRPSPFARERNINKTTFCRWYRKISIEGTKVKRIRNCVFRR